MPVTHSPVRHRRRSSLLAVVVSTVLVAGCAGAASPSLRSSPGASPSPATTPTVASVPPATPTSTTKPSPSVPADPTIELAKSSVPRARPVPGAATGAARSINAFGLDLYPRLLADPGLALDGKNLVFSPTSVAFAFGMARAGARGDTAAQIDDVLHATGWDALAGGLNALDQGLATRNAEWTDDGGTHRLALRIVNAAFAQRGYPVEQPFLDSIATYLGAGLGLVDYAADPQGARKLINAWVSEQTVKRIPELLSPANVSSATRLYLVNAVYLKANWAREFALEETANRPFTRVDGSRVDVPTMTVQGQQDIPLATGSGWRATELRYVGAEGSTPLAMTLIVPDDLSAFEGRFSASTLDQIVGKLDAERARQAKVDESAPEGCGTYPYAVKVFLPRFGIETKGNLAHVLRALGMRSAFDGAAADFSGIVDPARSGEAGLFIKAVIHQANIDVDEKGTEAAAATAIGFDTGGCTGPDPAKVVTIRLDRPFLFAVRDVETGAILFLGRVLDPSAPR